MTKIHRIGIRIEENGQLKQLTDSGEFVSLSDYERLQADLAERDREACDRLTLLLRARTTWMAEEIDSYLAAEKTARDKRRKLSDEP